MESRVEFRKLKHPLSYPFQGIRSMEDCFYELISKKSDTMGLKIWLELYGRDNKGKDEFFQSRISGLSIMEDLINVVNGLLDLPILSNKHYTYCNGGYNKVEEKLFARFGLV